MPCDRQTVEAHSVCKPSGKKSWIKHLKSMLKDYMDYSLLVIVNMGLHIFSGGKQPPSEHAAVWVPDNEAAICMHCKKTQFTVLNRRVSKFN